MLALLATQLFICLDVCAMFFLPRKSTPNRLKSVEFVFIGYSDEHKGYRCWDLVGRRLHILGDVTFDESHSYYPRPSSSSLSMDAISFLLLPDTPSYVPHVSLPPACLTLPPTPPYPSSSAPPSSPVCRPLSPFPLRYRRSALGVPNVTT